MGSKQPSASASSLLTCPWGGPESAGLDVLQTWRLSSDSHPSLDLAMGPGDAGIPARRELDRVSAHLQIQAASSEHVPLRRSNARSWHADTSRINFCAASVISSKSVSLNTPAHGKPGPRGAESAKHRMRSNSALIASLPLLPVSTSAFNLPSSSKMSGSQPFPLGIAAFAVPATETSLQSQCVVPASIFAAKDAFIWGFAFEPMFETLPAADLKTPAISVQLDSCKPASSPDDVEGGKQDLCVER